MFFNYILTNDMSETILDAIKNVFDDEDDKFDDIEY